MPKRFQMIGKKFNKLTVLEECNERKRGQKLYKCLCDCGNITYQCGHQLRISRVKSCGCTKGNIIHGKKHTRIYNIYCGIKARCYNKNNPRYKDYGERGIIMCYEWLHDFMSFYNWTMSHGYKEDLTIDRIDNDKGYSPSNCRWVDSKTQNNNQRSNVRLTYKGITKTMSEWANDLGVPYRTIGYRHRKEWEVKDVLFGKEK